MTTTNTRHRYWLSLMLALTLSLTAIGCSEEAQQGVKDAMKEGADKASEVADDAAKSAGETMEAAKASLGEGYASAMDQASGALEGIEGGGEVLTKLKSLFGSATETLSGVTDEATAETAASKLGDLAGSVDGIKGLLDKLPEGAQAAVSKFIGEGTGGLQGLAEKALAIPGVQEKLKPAIDMLMEKLKGLMGSE